MKEYENGTFFLIRPQISSVSNTLTIVNIEYYRAERRFVIGYGLS